MTNATYLRYKTITAAILVAVNLISLSTVSASGIAGAPAVGLLGAVVVDPYGNSPLTAVINLHSQKISDVTVTVHGKAPDGVTISYPVGPKTLLTHDGIPVFGLYQKQANRVTVEFTLEGQAKKSEYIIQTAAIQNRYIDSRNISDLDRVEVVKMSKGFEDRLYMINSYTASAQGSDLNWATSNAGKSAASSSAASSGGALPFDAPPKTYVIDTQGEVRWWLNQDAIYDGFSQDVDKRGWATGFNLTQNGTWIFVQGQKWYEMDAIGQILQRHNLPRNYIDMTHASWEMPNGNVLLRAAKANYVRPDGKIVHTVRDHIVEVNRSGQLVDVWNLNEILDPLRDSLLSALDQGAVCISLDLDNSGKKVNVEPDAPFSDAPGVGAGRNWAHVNSIQYDAKDDSVILSLRHQGIVKIGRDKQVRWILSASEGWNEALSAKLLKPVDADGKAIKCSPKGICESDFDFTYTQHAALLSPKDTLTAFDNGDARHFNQPAMANMKYSRFVEYQIDEKNMTIRQVWEYGKERGYIWYSPITSNVEYRQDRNTMFGFGGSVGLMTANKPTIGRINEIDYQTKSPLVEIDVYSNRNGSPFYQGLIVEPEKMFRR